MDKTIKKPARSVPLTKDELRELKKYCKGFSLEVDASLSLGVERNSLNRILAFGSGSEKYINRIREKLSQLQNPVKSLSK